MRATSSRSGLAITIMALAACHGPPAVAPPPDESASMGALQWMAGQELQLMRVAARVDQGAMSLCRFQRTYAPAMDVANLAAFDSTLRPAAARLWSVGDTLQVLVMDEDGDAARAGLRAGDRLLQLDTVRVATVADYHERLRAAAFLSPDSLPVTYVRDGEFHRAVLTPRLGCGYDVGLLRSPEVGAWSLGETIVVTTGLMDFLHGEDELAVVLAHEVAHIAKRHEFRRAEKGLLGFALGALGDVAYVIATGRPYNPMPMSNSASILAERAFSGTAEREADDAGLEALGRAGYDLGAAPPLWHRIAGTTPEPRMAREHPVTDERLVRMEATIALLRAKNAR